MIQLAVQRGHCFRKRGATGTSGDRGSEQSFADALARKVVDLASTAGISIVMLLADEMIPPCEVLLSFHQDGSRSGRATGASVGYSKTHANTAESARYAGLWKACYQSAGYPFGFRPNNYTLGLRRYYAWRSASAKAAKAAVLMEHGFATNHEDEAFMWDHMDDIAEAHLVTLTAFLDIDQGEDMPAVYEVLGHTLGDAIHWQEHGGTISAIGRETASDRLADGFTHVRVPVATINAYRLRWKRHGILDESTADGRPGKWLELANGRGIVDPGKDWTQRVMSDSDVGRIAAAVAPLVKIDMPIVLDQPTASSIAKAVNDDAARRLQN